MQYQDMLSDSLVKSVGVAVALVALAGPVAVQAQDESSGVQGAETQAATGEASEASTVDKMIEKSKELMETGSEKAKEGWDKTKEVSGEAWDKTKEVSGETWDKTKEVSGETWDKTKEVSGKAWDKTKEVSGEAWDATKNTASKAGAAAKSGYEAAKETYQEAGSEGETAETTQ